MGAQFLFDNANHRFRHLDAGGRVVWGSDAPPGALMPDSAFLAWSGDIVWPDNFVRGNAMYYGWNDLSGASAQYQGVSWSVVRAGTWGPDAASPYNLPRILLGTVPEDCNYLDAWLNTTNSKPVSWTWFFNTVATYQAQGKNILLDGGCAKIEGTSSWRRIIKIVAAGTDNGDGTRNIYLERWQSVKSSPSWLPPGGIMKSGAQVYTGGATGQWENLWTHDGDPSGWLATWLQKTGNDINSLRGGSGQPSTADVSDYSSSWTSTITVCPGYAHT